MSSTVSCSSAAASVGGVMPEVGQDLGHRQRVGDVRLAALAALATVPQVGHGVGPLDVAEVGLGVVGPDDPEQRLEHRHRLRTALRGQPREALPDPGGRTGRRGQGAATGRQRRGGVQRRRGGSHHAVRGHLFGQRLSLHLRDLSSLGIGAPDRSRSAPLRRPAGRARRGRGPSCGRPGTSSSRSTDSPTTSPPARRTRSAVAAAVPPVASTSSTTSTRAPGAKASAWISRVASPYSRA